MHLVYLDHAATSWPKPVAVKQAVIEVMDSSGNPGRSGHQLSLGPARVIHKTRQRLARFFNAPNPSHIVFALNATDALNMAIKGMVRSGGHVITTCFEHNSVLRPLYAFARRGEIELTVIESRDGLSIYPEQIKMALQPHTNLVAVTHASNVTGAILDIKSIGKICAEHGCEFLVDASQSAGVLPLDVQELQISCLASSGHKGLLGPQGTGVLYVKPGLDLVMWREGGTGSASHEVYQPEFMPDRLEAGTPNTPGIAGLGAGVVCLEEIGLTAIRSHEHDLLEHLRSGLAEIPGIKLYGPGGKASVGVVSINIDGWDGSDLSVALEQEYNVLTRPGLHCAPLAHEAIGTGSRGTVRLSVGYSTTREEVEHALKALRSLAVKN